MRPLSPRCALAGLGLLLALGGCLRGGFSVRTPDGAPDRGSPDREIVDRALDAKLLPSRPASCDRLQVCRDPSFATNGVLLLDVGGVDNLGWSSEGIAEQPDGRLVVVGKGGVSSNLDFLALRLLEDGALDSSFGASGVVTLDLGSNQDEVKSVSLLPDGRILLVGMSNAQPAVVRLAPGGALDPSFGEGGIVLGGIPLKTISVNGHRQQPDGKLLCAGHAQAGNWDLLLFRLLPAGAFDPGFGDAGHVRVDFASGDEFGNAPRLLPDGRILLAGSTYQGTQRHFDVAVVRLTSSGALDPSFGVDGRVATDLAGKTERGSPLIVLPDGKLLVGGHSDDADPRPILLRYTSSGALDPSFGVGGAADLSTVGRGALRALLLLEDGRILAAGSRYNGHDRDMLVVYLSANGKLDAGVGGGKGFQTIDAAAGRDDEVDHALLDRRGRLLLFGVGRGPVDADFALVRLWPD